MKKLNRREFVQTTTAATVAAAAIPRTLFGQAPAVMTPKSVKPVVVSSSNGHKFKNGGTQTCVEKAFAMITGGSDVLDALLAGGVAEIEGVRTPSKVAQLVMDETDHHLLVGKGAQEFARGMGLTIEDDLNTENSRKKWLEWKRRTDPLHYLSPKDRQRAYHQVALDMIAEGWIDPDHYYGTINCDGISPKGEICGVTTTSGLAWKIPGRAGDSPILGAGLYVDGEIGAAGSTGRGEANLYNLCSFVIVDEMRRGAHPKDAALTALRRVAKNTIEKRLLNGRGQPNFGLSFYVLNAKGEYAGVAMYESTYAVCTENGPETLQCAALYEGRP